MIEYWQGSNGKWYWHFRAKNGRITADGSEGYSSASNARRAARKFGMVVTFAAAKSIFRKARNG